MSIPRGGETPRRSKSFSGLQLPGLLTLLIGLLISIALFLRMHRHEQDLEDANFERRANAQIAAFQIGMDNAIQALQVIDQSFKTFGPLTREQFHRVTKPLLARYPYVQNFSYHEIVRESERPAFEARMRQSYPDFAVTDLENGKLVRAQSRNSYRVITYLEPMAGNEMVFGLDAAGYTSRQDEAVRRATDTGLASATALYQSVQEIGDQRGFAVLMPVYRTGAAPGDIASRRQAVVGYNVAMFRAGDLVEKIMKAGDLLLDSIDINVYAGVAPDERSLAYRHGNPPALGDGKWTVPDWFYRDEPKMLSRTVDIAGTPWHIIVSAKGLPLSEYHLGSLCALFGGILFSILAAAYNRMLALRAYRTQQLVEERTAELKVANELLIDDIAARKRTEQALRHAEHVLTHAQKVAHLGSWELDVKRGVLQCSDEFFRICGLEPQSIQLDIPFVLSISHPEDKQRAEQAVADALRTGKEYRIEKRIVRPNGSIRHVISQGELIFDENHELQRVEGSYLDVSEQKRTEIALRESREKLRELTAHLERIKEEERKRIAREVHDELGSVLTGIKAYLSVALDRTSRGDAAVEKLLADAAELVDVATETVRRVITDLRPSVLDQLGVWAALEWYASQIEKRTGLRCACSIDEQLAAIQLDPDRSIMLFRIVQESLNNVVRHAGASKVELRARLQGCSAIVEIEDDGKGIDTGLVPERPSWGIVGMHERARYFGGSLSIRGETGKGTVVSLQLPIEDLLMQAA